MRKKYIQYIIIIVAILLTIIISSAITKHYEAESARTYLISHFMILHSFFSKIMIGALIGLDSLFKELSKKGTLKYDFKKLVILGLPLIIMIIYTYRNISYILVNISLVKVILGYVIMSCFYKDDINTEVNVLQSSI